MVVDSPDTAHHAGLAAEMSIDAINLAARVVAVTLQFSKMIANTAVNITAENERDVSKKALLAREFADVAPKLGPTFVKLGQTLASRPDITGVAAASTLETLQDAAPPFDAKEAAKVIRDELGSADDQTIRESDALPAGLFTETHLPRTPIAAASFGQVYRLHRASDGVALAVKVQRPGALRRVALDVVLLRKSLRVVSKAAGTSTDFSYLADEVGRALYGELDYIAEAANSEKFAALHASCVPRPCVPAVVRDGYTTTRILTTRWVNGASPKELLATARDSGSDKARRDALQLVDLGVACSLAQLLDTKYMHGDPHSGNLLLAPAGANDQSAFAGMEHEANVVDEPRLVYLDFGSVVEVTPEHASAMLASLVHLHRNDWRAFAMDLGGMGLFKPGTDAEAVADAVAESFGGSSDNNNGEPVSPSFTAIAKGLAKVALKFRFRLPGYYVVVVRSLATLEGVALAADPNFKIVRAAYPRAIAQLLSASAGDPKGRELLEEIDIASLRGVTRGGADVRKFATRGGAQGLRQLMMLLLVGVKVVMKGLLKVMASMLTRMKRRLAFV